MLLAYATAIETKVFVGADNMEIIIVPPRMAEEICTLDPAPPNPDTNLQVGFPTNIAIEDDHIDIYKVVVRITNISGAGDDACVNGCFLKVRIPSGGWPVEVMSVNGGATISCADREELRVALLRDLIDPTKIAQLRQMVAFACTR